MEDIRKPLSVDEVLDLVTVKLVEINEAVDLLEISDGGYPLDGYHQMKQAGSQLISPSGTGAGLIQPRLRAVDTLAVYPRLWRAFLFQWGRQSQCGHRAALELRSNLFGLADR